MASRGVGVEWFGGVVGGIVRGSGFFCVIIFGIVYLNASVILRGEGVVWVRNVEGLGCIERVLWGGGWLDCFGVIGVDNEFVVLDGVGVSGFVHVSRGFSDEEASFEF